MQKCRVPGETYQGYMDRPGRSTLTREQEKKRKLEERIKINCSKPPTTGSSVSSQQGIEITGAIKLDTTELDRAIKKAKKLLKLLDEIESRRV